MGTQKLLPNEQQQQQHNSQLAFFLHSLLSDLHRHFLHALLDFPLSQKRSQKKVRNKALSELRRVEWSKIIAGGALAESENNVKIAWKNKIANSETRARRKSSHTESTLQVWWPFSMMPREAANGKGEWNVCIIEQLVAVGSGAECEKRQWIEKPDKASGKRVGK